MGAQESQGPPGQVQGPRAGLRGAGFAGIPEVSGLRLVCDAAQHAAFFATFDFPEGVTAELEVVALDARVRAICGDLASPRLGLSDRVWLQLAETIDTIVHNGAWVDYILDYEALRPSNVEGTRELIELACVSSRKQLHFVSSTTIFGWTGKRELLEREKRSWIFNQKAQARA